MKSTSNLKTESGKAQYAVRGIGFVRIVDGSGYAVVSQPSAKINQLDSGIFLTKQEAEKEARNQASFLKCPYIGEIKRT